MSKKHTLDIQAHTSEDTSGAQTADTAGKERDTIRVVIRDAKPPFLARFLQFCMRLICFLLLICVCGIGIPRLFGINEYNVLTGSMTPTYPVGTLVFVQPKDPSSIRPGEVVTVVMDEQLTLVTHRVIANDYESKTITTKGDANNSSDTPSRYENIVGVVCFSLPYVGEVVDYLTNDDAGRVVGIAILIGILALTFLAEGICSLLTKQKAHFLRGAKGAKAVKSAKKLKSTQDTTSARGTNKNKRGEHLASNKAGEHPAKGVGEHPSASKVEGAHSAQGGMPSSASQNVESSSNS